MKLQIGETWDGVKVQTVLFGNCAQSEFPTPSSMVSCREGGGGGCCVGNGDKVNMSLNISRGVLVCVGCDGAV